MILWSSRGTCGVLFIILTDITFEQNKKFPLLYVFLRSPKCMDPILGPFANQSPCALFLYIKAAQDFQHVTFQNLI